MEAIKAAPLQISTANRVTLSNIGKRCMERRKKMRRTKGASRSRDGGIRCLRGKKREGKNERHTLKEK